MQPTTLLLTLGDLFLRFEAEEGPASLGVLTMFWLQSVILFRLPCSKCHCAALAACLQSERSPPATLEEPEQFAKEHIYLLKDNLVGLRQVIFEAGLGHLLGEDDSVDEMEWECDPVLTTDASDSYSEGMVAWDAPMRQMNHCGTGIALEYCVPHDPYTISTPSGSKRKRCEFEDEEEQAEDDSDDDSCKRFKPAEETLEELLEYLQQCSRDTLVLEAKKWEHKVKEVTQECKKANADYTAARTLRENRWQAVQDERKALKEEYIMLCDIIEAHNLERLAFETDSNFYDGYFYNDSEGGSVYLGMAVSELKPEEEDKEEEEVISAAPTAAAVDFDKNKATDDENKENSAPFQPVKYFAQHILAPFHNAQRVLKEYNRRYQMRERRGETRW